METSVYLLPGDFDAGPIWQKISERYELEQYESETVQISCLDTFDWRLFNDGLCVCRKRNRYHLEDGIGRLLLTGNGSRKKFPFWWDLEESELRDTLKPVVEMRALLEQFLLERSTRKFKLLNRDEKTVLRLTLVQSVIGREGRHASRALHQALYVEPLRGYPKPFNTVNSILTDDGLQQWGGDYSYIEEAHALHELDPQLTSSKFKASLEKEETVGEVVRDICLQLRDTMLLNLPGVQEDIDSEFLHDFRVAIRRTRSLLSLLKKYLPQEELSYYQGELKWLGSVTGPTRDLDVYLLAKDDFQAMLPPLLYPGLDHFFADLESRRKRSLRMLRRNLASERFLEFLEKWEQFLNQLPEMDEPGIKRNCYKTARKIIRKRFTRILQDGGAITPETPDENVHELRIECKKFRYMLEFFHSLFYTPSVDKYLKQLKRLQNNLGDFNDLSVQSEMLAERMAEITPGSKQAIETGAALGGLIVHLLDTKKQVRRKFEKTFAAFASQENRELLESIFNEAGKKAVKP